MVTHGREEPVGGSPRAIGARIGEDEVVEILAYIGIYGIGAPGIVVIITGSGNKVRAPAPDEGSHIGFALAGRAVVPDHRKACGRRYRGQGGANRGGCADAEHYDG